MSLIESFVEVLHLLLSTAETIRLDSSIANICPFRRDRIRDQLHPRIRTAGTLYGTIRLPNGRKSEGVLP